MELYNISISTFDRMFPNQDTIPKGGYGNLIALPFQTNPSKCGNTLLIDRNFYPIANQINYLKSIHKLTKNEIDLLIQKLSNGVNDINYLEEDVQKVSFKIPQNIEYPVNINVILKDMIYIDKTGLNAVVKNNFRKLATFTNPEFYKKQRLRMSVYNTPMVIDCSMENEKYLKLPRGTYDFLIKLCEENHIKLSQDDERFAGIRLNVKFKGKLRKEQNDALQAMLKYDNGILWAPTGFGKTVLGCKLIEKRKVNTLILVNKLSLLRQWQKKIKEFLDIKHVGEISGNKKDITNNIDVASIKSIWNNGNVLNIMQNYGMIIIDECHHTAAFTYEKAINTGNAKYIYGITATPKRENGHTPIIKMQCGDIRYKIDALEYNKNLGIPMKVFVKKSHLNFTDPKINNYELNEINDFIAKDIIRSEKIIKDVLESYQNGKNILILTERLEHLEYIFQKLQKKDILVLKYCGGIGKKILKEYQRCLNETNRNKIIIATGPYIGEGFDDEQLDTLFLTMPISGETRVTQYAGRLHRTTKDKKEITIYDYVDDNFSKTRNMFIKRKKIYRRLGYEIIEEERYE